MCLKGIYNSKVLITPYDPVNRISKLRCDLSLTVVESSVSVFGFSLTTTCSLVQFRKEVSMERVLLPENTPWQCVRVCVYVCVCVRAGY